MCVFCANPVDQQQQDLIMARGLQFSPGEKCQVSVSTVTILYFVFSCLIVHQHLFPLMIAKRKCITYSLSEVSPKKSQDVMPFTWSWSVLNINGGNCDKAKDRSVFLVTFVAKLRK